MKIAIRYMFIFFMTALSSNGFSSEIMNLDQGSAKTINVKREISTVFVANPEVADYKIIDANKVVVYGIGVGTTSFIVYDKSGHEIHNSELVINQSLRLLKQTLLARFPGEKITVSNIGDQVVLDGIVGSEEVKKKVYRLVGEMLNKDRRRQVTKRLSQDGSDDGELEFSAEYIYEQIINNLKVLATEQINVKITVAEVSSSFLSTLGVSYSDSLGESGTFINKLTNFSSKDIVAVISAIGNESIGQILAEPNLSVISGEKASFLVGGEIPIAIRDDKGVSISYKEYGVRLSMIAKVTDSENIRLSLYPEVSTIDQSNKTFNGLLSVPALHTRKAETTVQLKNGQSFVLAGLLRTEEQESLSKVPLLGDIPILGALFSQSRTNRNKTELVIVATVNLVNPVEPEKIKLPGFHRTSDLERLLGINLADIKDPMLEKTISQGGFN